MPVAQYILGDADAAQRVAVLHDIPAGPIVLLDNAQRRRWKLQRPARNDQPMPIELAIARFGPTEAIGCLAVHVPCRSRHAETAHQFLTGSGRRTRVGPEVT